MAAQTKAQMEDRLAKAKEVYLDQKAEIKRLADENAIYKMAVEDMISIANAAYARSGGKEGAKGDMTQRMLNSFAHKLYNIKDKLANSGIKL